MNFWRILVISLLSFLPGNLSAFNDIAPEDPQMEVFKALSSAGIMTPDNQNNIQPNRVPTRAEALTIALRAGGVPINYENFDGNAYYKDIDPNEWFAPVVKTAVDKRIVWNNVENFRPNEAVTKAEFLAFLFRSTRVNLTRYLSQKKFVADDIPEDAWFAQHFAYAKQYQIAHLPADNLYRPLKWLTRREIAMITERQLKLYHGDKTTADFVELQAKMDQYITLLNAGKKEKAQVHLHRIVQLTDKVTRSQNNQDVIAAQAISLAMKHFKNGLQALKSRNSLSAIENLHLAAYQAERAAEKSNNLEAFATELTSLINQTLNTYYTASYAG